MDLGNRILIRQVSTLGIFFAAKTSSQRQLVRARSSVILFCGGDDYGDGNWEALAVSAYRNFQYSRSSHRFIILNTCKNIYLLSK